MAEPDCGCSGSSPRESLGREDRLRRRPEYRSVQSRGRRVHTKHFIFILLPRDDNHRRIGVTVTRKVGTAVQRNRVKRLVREVFRRNRHRFPEGSDVVCIAKRGAPRLGYSQVLDEVAQAEQTMAQAVTRARRRAPRTGEGRK